MATIPIYRKPPLRTDAETRDFCARILTGLSAEEYDRRLGEQPRLERRIACAHALFDVALEASTGTYHSGASLCNLRDALGRDASGDLAESLASRVLWVRQVCFLVSACCVALLLVSFEVPDDLIGVPLWPRLALAFYGVASALSAVHVTRGAEAQVRLLERALNP